MIKGIIAPALTFFNKDGSVNEALCRWHMGWMLDNGVNGLFVTGTYGSGYLMSPKERSKVFQLAKQLVRGRDQCFVIAHVGCPDTESSLYLAKQAKRLKLDGISAVTPYNYPYTMKELHTFYRTLLEEKGDMEVFAYNNPRLTGITLDFAFMRKLIPFGLTGVKDSSLNPRLAEDIRSYNRKHSAQFQYIAGSTSDWLTFSQMGFHTMIAGVCNYAPELVAELYSLSRTDPEKASRLSSVIEQMSLDIKQANSLLSCHLALKARGFEAGCMRAPLAADYRENVLIIKQMRRILSAAFTWETES